MQEGLRQMLPTLLERVPDDAPSEAMHAYKVLGELACHALSILSLEFC